MIHPILRAVHVDILGGHARFNAFTIRRGNDSSMWPYCINFTHQCRPRVIPFDVRTMMGVVESFAASLRTAGAVHVAATTFHIAHNVLKGHTHT